MQPSTVLITIFCCIGCSPSLVWMVPSCRGSGRSYLTGLNVSVSVTACRQRSYYSTAFLRDQSLVPCCFCSIRPRCLTSLHLSDSPVIHTPMTLKCTLVLRCRRLSGLQQVQQSALLAECTEHLDRWMGQNRLKLNAEKTQLLWLGTRQQLAKLTITRQSTPIGDYSVIIYC